MRAGLVVLITAVAIALPTAVAAQVDPGRALQLAPSQPVAPGGPQGPADGPRPESMVRVAPPWALDIADQGTLNPKAGGFGRDVWRGRNRSEILALSDRIRTRAASPAMRPLTERLLLTDADRPPLAEPGRRPLRAARAGLHAELTLARRMHVAAGNAESGRTVGLALAVRGEAGRQRAAPEPVAATVAAPGGIGLAGSARAIASAAAWARRP